MAVAHQISWCTSLGQCLWPLLHLQSVCHLSSRASRSLMLIIIRNFSSASRTESEHDFAESWRTVWHSIFNIPPQKNEGWGICSSFHLNFRLFIAHTCSPSPRKLGVIWLAASQTDCSIFRAWFNRLLPRWLDQSSTSPNGLSREALERNALSHHAQPFEPWDTSNKNRHLSYQQYEQSCRFSPMIMDRLCKAHA